MAVAGKAEKERLLAALQDDLEAIYQVEAPARVADFVIDQARWEAWSQSGAPEELLVVQSGENLDIGLYLDERVYTALEGREWTREKLAAHCQAVEGVSHFVYLTHRASLPRPVSQLELELQAEIDKFATVLLQLWEEGMREAASALRSVLFERVSYRKNLSPEEFERYRKANVLASLYCRFLEAKYVMANSIEGFLADLRRIYRLGGGEKLSYAACGAAL
jgi:hypothetical protein